MSSEDRLDPRRQMLDEIWEELDSLSGGELDAYLASLDLDTKGLLSDFAKAKKLGAAAPKRALFEEARRQVWQQSVPPSAKILAFDLERKKQIAAAIRKHADKTGEMTIAARNRTIEDENDVDTFLEACLLLGVIDDDGNLK